MITIHTDPAPARPRAAVKGLWFYRDLSGNDAIYMASPGERPVYITPFNHFPSLQYRSWGDVDMGVRTGFLEPLDEGATVNLILTRLPQVP